MATLASPRTVLNDRITADPYDPKHIVARLLYAASDADWSDCERDLGIARRLLTRGAGISALEALVEGRFSPIRAGESGFLLCDDDDMARELANMLVNGQAEVTGRLGVDEPVVLVDARVAGQPFAFAEPFAPSCAYIRLIASHDLATDLRHELAHAGLQSGMRLLDEGMADWFSRTGDEDEDRAAPDPSRQAPLRGLLTTPFTTDIHFESVAPTPEERRALRKRARDLVAAIEKRGGPSGLSALFGAIAALRDPVRAILLIEESLGSTIEDWESPKLPVDPKRLDALRSRLLRARVDRDLDTLDACAAEGLDLGAQFAGWEAIDAGVVATFVGARERLARDQEVSPTAIAAADAWIAEARVRGLPPGRAAALSGHRASLAAGAGRAASAEVRTITASERAEKAFRQALAFDGDDVDAHSGLAHLLTYKPEARGGGEAGAAPHFARVAAALAMLGEDPDSPSDPASAPDDAIRLRALRVGGDDGFELNVADFRLGRGERVALVGSNGSGKSTLIDAVLGLVAVEGTCEVLGGPVQTLSFDHRRRARIGALLNQAPLPRSLKVSEAVRLLDKVFGRAGPEIFEAMGLEELANKKIATLSRGQGQRLMIYAALGHDPDLVILDEASLGLDARYAGAMRALVFGSWGQGKSMILCSHLPGDLDRVDRVVLLEAGHVKSQGRVGDLVRQLGWSWRGQIEGVDLAACAAEIAKLEDFRSSKVVQHRSLHAYGGPAFGRAFGVFAAGQTYSTYSVSKAGIHDVVAGGGAR